MRSIYRSDLDGTSCQEIVKLNILHPRALAVDAHARRIFWADMDVGQVFHIKSADYGGSHQKTLVANIDQPDSISVLDGKLFWTSSVLAKVKTANSDNGSDVTTLATRLQGLRGVVAVQVLSEVDRLRHPCSARNGNCSQLCRSTLRDEERDPWDESGRTCACAIGLHLNSDQVTCVQQMKCEDVQFKCVTGGECAYFSFSFNFVLLIQGSVYTTNF